MKNINRRDRKRNSLAGERAFLFLAIALAIVLFIYPADHSSFGDESLVSTLQNLWSTGSNTLTGASIGVEGFTVQNAGNASQCGGINQSITLTANLTQSGGSCLIVNASNIVIDGAGFAINGDTIGVNISGFNHVTIKNLYLNTSRRGIAADNLVNLTVWNLSIITPNISLQRYAISMYNVNQSNISNNTLITYGRLASGIYIIDSSDNRIAYNYITTNGSTAHGIEVIFVDVRSERNNISFNYITTIRSDADGIHFETNNPLSNIGSNTIYTTGIGIFLTNADNTTITSNIINVSGSAGRGIRLFSGTYFNYIGHNRIDTDQGIGIQLAADRNNTIISNIINSSSGDAIVFTSASAGDTYLINNNLTSTLGFEIRENYTSRDASSSELYYIIYNNSFGEIRWIDNGTGNFLRNLTINVTNDQGLGLDRNLIIRNNTIALNTSAFSQSRISSSANLSLFSLGLPFVRRIMRVETFNGTPGEIQQAGSDCDASGTCTIISYSSSTSILRFNTSSFSSFSANESVSEFTPPDVTLLLPINNSVFNTSQVIEIAVNVSDNVVVGTVLANITYPNGSTTLLTLTNGTDYKTKFNASFIIPLASGVYNITFVANDTNNNYNRTERTNFTALIGCGVFTTSITLNRSITITTIPGTCFTLNASNIVLDGAGYSVTSNGTGFGISIENVNNVTVKNLILTNFTRGIHSFLSGNLTIWNNTIITLSGSTLRHGISFMNVTQSNISNNTIIINSSTSDAINLSSGSNYNKIFFNYLNSSKPGGDGIDFGLLTSSTNRLSNENNISGNTILVKSTGVGIRLNGGSNYLTNNIILTETGTGISIAGQDTALSLPNNTISSNTINTSGAVGITISLAQGTYLDSNLIEHLNTAGITLSNAQNTTFINNIINTSGTGDNIRFHSGTVSNIRLINNNLTSAQGFEIRRSISGAVSESYLIYNNSFGEIRWTDNSTGGFLRNLTLNVDNDQGLGLGRNLFIDNNTIALNTSAFGDSLINSSANLTFFNLNHSTVTAILMLSSYSTNRSEILATGSNCNGTTCSIISYNSTTGTLLFNTSSFSSFAAVDNTSTPAAAAAATDTTSASSSSSGGGGNPCPPGTALINGKCTFLVTECAESWVCSAWSECAADGTNVRTCLDENNCGTKESQPPETQSCTYSISAAEPEINETVQLTSPALVGRAIFADIGTVLREYNYYWIGFIVMVIVLLVAITIRPFLWEEYRKLPVLLHKPAPPLPPLDLKPRFLPPEKLSWKEEFEHLTQELQKVRQWEEDWLVRKARKRMVVSTPSVPEQLLEKELQNVSRVIQGYAPPAVATQKRDTKLKQIELQLAQLEQQLPSPGKIISTLPSTAGHGGILPEHISPPPAPARSYPENKKLQAALAQIKQELSALETAAVPSGKVITELPSTAGHASVLTIQEQAQLSGRKKEMVVRASTPQEKLLQKRLREIQERLSAHDIFIPKATVITELPSTRGHAAELPVREKRDLHAMIHELSQKRGRLSLWKKLFSKPLSSPKIKLLPPFPKTISNPALKKEMEQVEQKLKRLRLK